MQAFAPTSPLAKLLLFFITLSFLCMGAHELIHHLTMRAVCGSWGEMTFSQFFLAPGCEQKPWWIATLAGPMLTYGLLWTGLALRSQFGLLLIFANLPLGRAMSVLTRSGDEMLLARLSFGDKAWPALLAITAILLLPPLVVAYRRLPQRGRWWRFLALLIIPLLWDFAFKRLLLNQFLTVVPGEIGGIPFIILFTYAVAAALLLASRPAIRSTDAVADPYNGNKAVGIRDSV